MTIITRRPITEYRIILIAGWTLCSSPPDMTNKNPHQSTKTIVRMMAMRRRIAIPTVMSSSREYAWEAESAKLDVWA
jgi:hypothetical protein